MAKNKLKPKSTLYSCYRNDGSLWATGRRSNEIPTGYWEFFRRDGTKLRCGEFENGKRVGLWITCDKDGKIYRLRNVKSPRKRT